MNSLSFTIFLAFIYVLQVHAFSQEEKIVSEERYYVVFLFIGEYSPESYQVCYFIRPTQAEDSVDAETSLRIGDERYELWEATGNNHLYSMDCCIYDTVFSSRGNLLLELLGYLEKKPDVDRDAYGTLFVERDSKIWRKKTLNARRGLKVDILGFKAVIYSVEGISTCECIERGIRAVNDPSKGYYFIENTLISGVEKVRKPSRQEITLIKNSLPEWSKNELFIWLKELYID